MANRSSFSFSWKKKLNVAQLEQFDQAFFLNSNDDNSKSLLALGNIKSLLNPTFEALELFQKTECDWLFGYLSYDAKNQLATLNSSNKSTHETEDLSFIIPEIVIEWVGLKGVAHYHPSLTSKDRIVHIIDHLSSESGNKDLSEKISFKPLISKQEYLDKIDILKNEIQYGNIYEINFCQEFQANETIDPYQTYQRLNSISPTPYSCFMKLDDFFLMCASPEQYLEKRGNKVLSRPIKGTIQRGNNLEEDINLKNRLFDSEKDRSENVMIVDLVRNDLSKCAKKGSVKVEELFGIYSFPQLHQMISTISAELKKESTGIDAIKNSFPMGSMTGAPKLKAMELIEKEEMFKRNLYAGSVGYFDPKGDFTFNVIIRSLFYSSKKPVLSFAVGGAITDGSNSLDEYDESMLKAKAIFEVFS